MKYETLYPPAGHTQQAGKERAHLSCAGTGTRQYTRMKTQHQMKHEMKHHEGRWYHFECRCSCDYGTSRLHSEQQSRSGLHTPHDAHSGAVGCVVARSTPNPTLNVMQNGAASGRACEARQQCEGECGPNAQPIVGMVRQPLRS